MVDFKSLIFIEYGMEVFSFEDLYLGRVVKYGKFYNKVVC